MTTTPENLIPPLPLTTLAEEPPSTSRVIATLVCDLTAAPLGMRSRLLNPLAGRTILQHTLARVLAVETLHTIVLLTHGLAASAEDRAATLTELGLTEYLANSRVQVLTLIPRPDSTTRRVQAGRIWGLMSWRGGAGQWTVFDEDYHPQSVAAALEKFGDPQSGHILCLPAHAALASPQLLADLVEHHLHKNHELQFTYTTAAPGLAGFMLQAELARELGKVQALPGQLLAYDPQHPVYDTLIREACMPVDPALSRLPNRFLFDHDRAWQTLAAHPDPVAQFTQYLQLAPVDLARQFHADRQQYNPAPLELEIDLTPNRNTEPPGTLPTEIRHQRTPLSAADWESWFANQQLPDDLTITFGSTGGDPLLYPDLLRVLRAARKALWQNHSTTPQSVSHGGGGGRGIYVQTDLLADPAPLLAALEEDLIDTLSITFYGDDPATYHQVAWHGSPPSEGTAPDYAQIWKNFEPVRALAQRLSRGLPLVIGRLLKVRSTVGQIEPFFDRWINNGGWAVIDYPTDRAGTIPFASVVDMTPGRRRPCRRIQTGSGRLLILPDGTAVACDQCVTLPGLCQIGHIQSATLQQLWHAPALEVLRATHQPLAQNDAVVQLEVDGTPLPCAQCREWHRP